MPGPTREQAAATLEDGNAALQALCARLSADELVRPATIGGGAWSAKDLLAHVAFWEELAAQTLADWRRGQRPAVEDLVSADAIDAANARNQERSATQSPAEVSARAEAAHRAILDAIRALSDDEWRTAPVYADAHEATLGDLLGGVLGAPAGPFRHAFAHLADLQAYVDAVHRA